MHQSTSDWVKKEYPERMSSEEFEVVEAWFRKDDSDNIETYILVRDKNRDRYTIRYNYHQTQLGTVDIIKDTISKRFRNISFDFNKGTIQYESNVEFSVNIRDCREVSEYDSREKAKENLNKVLS